ncbi:14719_t:CDS:2, partial [Acaulospora colombiana]
ASIVAALASVVSLQWVAEYDAAVSRSGSSPEDRVKRRQFRYGGMKKWKMREVIAALPVLLYCSLVLFFVGLAQWMWNVHTTVGGVITGGALLGAAFYVVTTLLAVVFPSSPFRAPIVRWIYVSVHLILRPFILARRSSSGHAPQNGVEAQETSLKDRIQGILIQAWRGVSTLNSFLLQIPSRFSTLTIQGRDKVHIDLEQKQLIGNSLAWVAQSLSISRDSHRRLLFLVQEFLKLDEDQWLSNNLQKIPWGQIVHFLASEYAQHAASRKLTEEDERELAILFRCLQKLTIGAVADPGDERDIALNFGSFGGSRDETIDPIYLLFYDIGVPEESLSVEAQIGLRVGCLNQLHYLSQSVQEIRDMHKEIILMGISHMYDYLLPRLSRALAERIHDDAQDRVNNLIFLMHLQSPPLRGSSAMALTRTGGKIPVARPSNLIQQLNCVMWIESQTYHPYIDDVLNALLVTQNRTPAISLLWKPTITDEEVTAILTLVDAHHREEFKKSIGILHKAAHMNRVLLAFDELITRGCHEQQQCVIIELIFNELRRCNSPPLVEYSNPVAKKLLDELRNPWIRLIVYLAAGMNEQLDDFCMQYSRLPFNLQKLLSQYLLEDGYFINPPSARRVQMRWWNQLAHLHTHEDRLRLEFTNPALGVDEGGDFLLEIIHSPFNIQRYSSSIGYERGYGFIPALLSGDDWRFCITGSIFKPECISRLLEFADDVKLHPGRFVVLLAKLAWADYRCFPTRFGPQYALNLYYMITLIEGYCTSDYTKSHIASSHDLARALQKLRDIVPLLASDVPRSSRDSEHHILQLLGSKPDDLLFVFDPSLSTMQRQVPFQLPGPNPLGPSALSTICMIATIFSSSHLRPTTCTPKGTSAISTEKRLLLQTN